MNALDDFLLFTTFIYHGHAVVLHKQARLSALNTRISYQQHNYWFRITDLVEAHMLGILAYCMYILCADNVIDEIIFTAIQQAAHCG